LIFFGLLLGIANANPDFAHIKQGTRAPFSGVILTNESLTEIIAKNEREVRQCKIDADFAFKEFEAKKDLEYQLLKIRYDSDLKSYLQMISARDAQIEKDKRKDVIQRWGFYGSFVLGVGAAIGTTYLVNQNFN
jgi:hypothetical protein